MREIMQEKVDVVTIYDRTAGRIAPYRLRWHGKTFDITKVGLHYTYWRGRDLHHIFTVTDGTTFFKLDHDTSNLQWMLTEVHDGLAD